MQLNSNRVKILLLTMVMLFLTASCGKTEVEQIQEQQTEERPVITVEGTQQQETEESDVETDNRKHPLM